MTNPVTDGVDETQPPVSDLEADGPKPGKRWWDLERTRQFARFAAWFFSLLLLLAGFAGAVRAEAPVWALAAIGLANAYVFARLSSADRRCTSAATAAEGQEAACGRHRRAAAAFSLIAVGCGTVTAASVFTEIPDVWGFAAMGGALYAFVRAIDHLRRWRSAHTRKLPVGVASVAIFLLVAAMLPIGDMRLWLGGAALLIGAVAVELWSAAFPDVLVENRRLAGGCGAVLVGVVSIGMYIKNDDPKVTALVIVAIGLVTGLLITANDMPVLLGVLLLAALWSGVPRDATYPPGQVPHGREPYFLVLGDSYISGEGTDIYFEGTNQTTDDGNECRRSPRSWPMLLNPRRTYDAADTLRIPRRVANRSCSGAVTADIRTGHDPRTEPEQLEAPDGTDRAGDPEDLADLIASHGYPRFVLVSIGGNDAQFSDIGVACALPGNCTDFLADATARLPAVGDEVARTLAEVRLAVDDPSIEVPVIAVPYPMPLYEGEGCRGVLLSKAEGINALAAALNGQIERAAEAAGAEYLDTIEGALADSAAQLCDPNNSAGLNFADFNPKAGSLWSALNPKNWTHNFVHPNESGHAVLRAAALEWFEGHPCILAGSCENASVSAATRLAGERASLDPEVGNDAAAAISDVVPLALGVLATLTGGWWLLITSMLGWESVRTAEGRERRTSIPERALELASRNR